MRLQLHTYQGASKQGVILFYPTIVCLWRLNFERGNADTGRVTLHFSLYVHEHKSPREGRTRGWKINRNKLSKSTYPLEPLIQLHAGSTADIFVIVVGWWCLPSAYLQVYHLFRILASRTRQRQLLKCWASAHWNLYKFFVWPPHTSRVLWRLCLKSNCTMHIYVSVGRQESSQGLLFSVCNCISESTPTPSRFSQFFAFC